MAVAYSAPAEFSAWKVFRDSLLAAGAVPAEGYYRILQA